MLVREALQGIEGTARFAAPVFEHMYGDHGRLDIRMTHPFLYLADDEDVLLSSRGRCARLRIMSKEIHV